MTVHVALLRAVNLGSHKRVAMPALREAVATLGFEDVRTLLQSGNVVFRGGPSTGAELERALEEACAKRLRIETEVFVRTAKQWRTMVAANPFPEEAARDPARLLVVFLKDAPAAAAVNALQGAIRGPEVVRAEGRQAYVVYPAGIGRSKLTSAVIEKRLGTRGTGRNWNTVLKLAALAED